MGYQIARVIENYYQDGEDAYFMRKVFTHGDGEVSRIGGYIDGVIAGGDSSTNGLILPRLVGAKGKKNDGDKERERDRAVEVLQPEAAVAQ